MINFQSGKDHEPAIELLNEIEIRVMSSRQENLNSEKSQSLRQRRGCQVVTQSVNGNVHEDPTENLKKTLVARDYPRPRRICSTA